MFELLYFQVGVKWLAGKGIQRSIGGLPRKEQWKNSAHFHFNRGNDTQTK